MSQILTTRSNSVRAGSAGILRWQESLKNAVRSGQELIELLDLQGMIAPSSRAARDFPVFVTREFLSRIQIGNPHDPLLRQVFPLTDETHPMDGYTTDPLQESTFTRCGGLIHKYARRVLLVTTGACAIHCRYCFRRHFPYSQVPHSLAQWQAAIDEISADSSIEEVLLSGGDPLMLVDSLLSDLIRSLSAIQHVKRLRIHSRLPIVLPSRITDEMLAMLKSTRLTTWMVVHSNHANEIDGEVADALSKLVDQGVPVLNQSVLLRGVNDDPDSLADLSSRLINLRVIPYYLHKLDHVDGAAHFSVPEETGRALIAALQARLPGYAVPRFVVEEPDQASKTTIL